MLCEFCKKIKPPHKTSNSNEGSHSCIVRHHAQFDNLIHSASEGCEICCLFAPYVQAAKNRRGGPIPKSQDRVLQGLFERHSYHEWWKTDQPFPTTGPEQLWVELYTEDDQIRILPNVNTTYRGSIICLSAGSIGDNSLGSSTLNNYCLDGEPVHDLHTLGQRMPGLRLFDYDPLLMMTHSDYQSPTPAFELYLGSGKHTELHENSQQLTNMQGVGMTCQSPAETS